VAEFRIGEHVTATVTGRVTGVYGYGAHISVAYEPAGTDVERAERDGEVVSFATESAAVTIERVAPAEWPPEPGDLWRDRLGTLWFARHMGGSQVSFVPTDGGFDERTPALVLETIGPLTFVHREPKDGES
jgi:hypothetical protein